MKTFVKQSDIQSSQMLASELNAVGELAPISIREAKRIIGDSIGELTDEDIQSMIFDLTAIARSYIRSVPKY